MTAPSTTPPLTTTGHVTPRPPLSSWASTTTSTGGQPPPDQPTWPAFGSSWRRRLAALDAFRARNNHVNVPRMHREGDVSLGSFVHQCRYMHAAGLLTPKEIADLEARGIIWRPHEHKWQRNLAALEAFRDREGHLRVPRHHQEDGLRLGYIAHNYACQQRLGTFPPERVAILAELGFPFRSDPATPSRTRARRARR